MDDKRKQNAIQIQMLQMYSRKSFTRTTRVYGTQDSFHKNKCIEVYV